MSCSVVLPRRFAVGLAPKGYLYTDRPAYRAGQLVNMKGVVRWVEQDQFVFKEGELEEWADSFYSCTGCRRCATYV